MAPSRVFYHFWSGRKDGRHVRCVLRACPDGLLLQILAGNDVVRERSFESVNRLFEWQESWKDEMTAQGWEVD